MHMSENERKNLERNMHCRELTMISYIQDDPPMILDISKVIKVH